MSCKPGTIQALFFALFFYFVLCVSTAQAAPTKPLLVLDPYLALNPSHRRNALDSRGGASIGTQINVPNLRTRPQSFGFTANMPFIRDPSNVQSGWGLGLGVFISNRVSTDHLKTYDAQTFEVSIGRSTIVPSLSESVGLQGFFESGISITTLKFDDGSEGGNLNIPSPRRSFFLRLGAMSLRGGQGIVDYKPYAIDQSFISALVFPIDFGDTVLSFSHTAMIKCFWSQLKCGTALGYTRYSQTLGVSGFDVPSQWINYGLSVSLYFFNRSAILRGRLLWDSVKTSSEKWTSGSGRPSLNTDLALVF
jgi:hypothetical protein